MSKDAKEKAGAELNKLKMMSSMSAEASVVRNYIDPKAILIYFLLVARAIDCPKDVLPTPGGPTKHKIGPFSDLTRCCTARYSKMRSLTFSKP
jgi:hypothetical protein